MLEKLDGGNQMHFVIAIMLLTPCRTIALPCCIYRNMISTESKLNACIEDSWNKYVEQTPLLYTLCCKL